MKNTNPNPKLPKHPINRIKEKKEERDKESAVSPWIEDYFDLNSFRLKPMTQAGIERLAYEIMEWSKKEDSLVFRDFFDDKGIKPECYYRWMRTYPTLNDAVEVAKGRIGSRREKGGLSRKYDSSLVTLGLAKYDPIWKEFMEWKALLKEKSASGNVTINLPDITTKVTVDEDKV